MKEKYCNRCKKIKAINEFSKNKAQKDGYCCWCKDCQKKYKKDYYIKNIEKIKKYYIANKDKRKKYNAIWRKANPEKVKELWKNWERNNHERRLELDRKWKENNPEKVKICKQKDYLKNSDKYKLRSKLWKINNHERHSELMRNWQKFRRENNPKYKISMNISRAINHSLISGKNGRHWEDLVGYTINDLMIHLEKQFKPGMSWDNYGLKGWSIDHIKPISSFNFKSYEDKEFKECWSLNNLQPLWHIENIKKGNKQQLEVSILE